MNYTETQKQIDKAIKQYYQGLFLIPDLLRIIEKTINQYLSVYPGTNLNEKITIQERLYRHSFRLILSVSKKRSKRA